MDSARPIDEIEFHNMACDGLTQTTKYAIDRYVVYPETSTVVVGSWPN